MSEKLKQCREDLAAALDRALEDNIVSPVFSSDPEWLESGRLLQPNAGAFINHPIARMYPPFNSPHLTQPVLQVLSERGPYYCVPAELALMDCNNISFKVKRLVFGNAEGLVLNANVPVLDGLFENGCENTDNLTQEYISSSQEANNYACLEAQGNSSPSNSCEELTKNLLEVIESTSMRTLEALAGKLEPFSESCLSPSQSAGSISAEDTLALFFADPPYSPIKKEPHTGKYRVSDDDNLINIVLDLEEDYNLVKKL
ncbi:uncharacterized protein C3orf62 homolog [Hemiscyllium ocellatum]|uniref:uncharacterized protein C3orf62 homolog n=1 Tax=Hemiscyllium ocellatum TaxID=170820 RepID=UPI002966728C|nr:uncharacterized protein C3orf62 homolog [Hemiscyllium ocellatum]